MEIFGIPVSEVEIPIPDPPARGVVPVENITKPPTGRFLGFVRRGKIR